MCLLCFLDLHYALRLIYVIFKFKGLSEILRDIRTSIYRICTLEEKLNWITTFQKWICNLTPEARDIFKTIVEKRRNCSLGVISPLFHNILLPVVRFSCLNRDQIFTSREAVIRDKRSRDNESRLLKKFSNCISCYKMKNCISCYKMKNDNILQQIYLKKKKQHRNESNNTNSFTNASVCLATFAINFSVVCVSLKFDRKHTLTFTIPWG